MKTQLLWWDAQITTAKDVCLSVYACFNESACKDVTSQREYMCVNIYMSYSTKLVQSWKHLE